MPRGRFCLHSGGWGGRGGHYGNLLGILYIFIYLYLLICLFVYLFISKFIYSLIYLFIFIDINCGGVAKELCEGVAKELCEGVAKDALPRCCGTHPRPGQPPLAGLRKSVATPSYLFFFNPSHSSFATRF